MAAKSGALVLIKIGNGGGPETFTTIGGLRTSVLAMNQRVLDASTVASGAWRKLLGGGGLRSFAIAGNGVFTDSAAEELLRAQAFSGAITNYEFIFANGDKISGGFMVTSYERSGNHDSAETYALSLESAGDISFVNGG